MLANCTEYHARPDLAAYLQQEDQDYGFGLCLPMHILPDLPRVEFMAEFEDGLEPLSPGYAVARFINKHVYAMPETADAALCRCRSLVSVAFETTRRCQLKCTYCGETASHDSLHDMPIDALQAFLDALPDDFSGRLHPNLGAELTARSDWMTIAAKCREKSDALDLLTNFSRNFTDEEIACLSNFSSLTISMETADNELHKKTRCGSDLKTIYWNILRLKAHCLLYNKKIPVLTASSALSDASIHGFAEFAETLCILGFTKIAAMPLVAYQAYEKNTKNAIYPKQLNTMPLEKRLQAHTMLQTVEKKMHTRGMHIRIQPGVLRQLQQNIHPEDKRIQPGLTRLCLDPWAKLLYWHNGETACCCHTWDREPLSLNADGKIDLNTRQLTDLRNALLTGYLPVGCFECPARPAVPIETLRNCVHALLNGDLAYDPITDTFMDMSGNPYDSVVWRKQP